MHAKRGLALCIDKNIDCILWVGVDVAEEVARLVGTDGDEAKVKGAAEGSNLCKGWTRGEMREFGSVVINGRIDF